LQDSERLLEAVRQVSNTVAEEDPETRRAEENREEERANLDAGEPEEDDGRPYTAREPPG
jgi:hypothetical protein